MAGELGVAQFGMLMRRGLVRPGEQGLELSAPGRTWITLLGLSLAHHAGARFAYPCMERSERKNPLAGALSRALLEHYLERHWSTAQRESRALKLTPKGWRELLPLLQADAQFGQAGATRQLPARHKAQSGISGFARSVDSGKALTSRNNNASCRPAASINARPFSAVAAAALPTAPAGL